jgi:hypothetical protein
MISPSMRDVLIEHLDGPVAIIAPGAARGLEAMALATRATTLRALLNRGLLRTDAYVLRARHTIMTEAGRRELAEALADWADALVRAGQLRADAVYASLTDAPLSSGDAPSP